MINVLIKATGTYFPESIRTIHQLAENSGKDMEECLATGIETVHTSSNVASSQLGATAFNELAKKVSIDPKSIDCVAWISEGVDDFLYMDTAKTFIEDIGGKTDGEIHTYQLYGGAGGTINSIKLIGNQIIANPSINKALIVSSQIWEPYSSNRAFDPTFLGDGAGVILLEKGNDTNMILVTKSTCLEQFYEPFAIPYGGTKKAISEKIIREGLFRFDTISESHRQGILTNIVRKTWETISEMLTKADFTFNDFDFIGICGFHKDYTEQLLAKLPVKSIIDPLQSKGYIGSLGLIEVINRFLYDPLIKSNQVMLSINMGLEGNIECMLIKKP